MSKEELPVYKLSYHYTPELIKTFSKIHLWYHRGQHPLLLQTPGVFLAGCIVFRLGQHFLFQTPFDINAWVTLLLMAVFDFFVLWLGFVHPYAFRKGLMAGLKGPSAEEIYLEFFEDRVRAKSSLFEAEYPYDKMHSCFFTPDCIYLYATKEQALLIPYESLHGKSGKAFQQFLLKKLPGKVQRKDHIFRKGELSQN